MRYMPGDYVDVDTGETYNSLVFNRMQEEYNITIINRFKQKLRNGEEERVYTTIEFKNGGKIWCGELFGSENKVNVLATEGGRQ